jgi:hypothetical protein
MAQLTELQLALEAAIVERKELKRALKVHSSSSSTCMHCPAMRCLQEGA